MDLHLVLNGRTRTVNVEPVEGGHRVTIDGEAMVVDAASFEAWSWSLVLPEHGHATASVGLSPAGTSGDLHVHLAAGTLAMRPLARTTRFGRGAADTAQAEGAQQVVAPMPGKVVKLLVTVGDEVKARQGLIVVEAMKMENELRSPKDGRVTDIAVSEGQSVEAGRLLVVVE
jgi:acetyl/propionyl-CoA carboxylase alpha subunit